MMRIYLALAALAIGVASFGQIHSFSGPVHTANLNLITGQVTYDGPSASTVGWVFDNTTTGLGYYYASDEADDLHMVGGGVLDQYKIGYYSPNGPTDCLTRFWGTDPGDGTAVYLGGFNVTNLLAGAYLYTITVPQILTLPTDVWMSQEYSLGGVANGAGALMYDPPTIGTSQNLFAKPSLGMPSYYWFGGSPVANFFEAVHVVPEPGTIAALAAGLVGLLGLRRRK